MTGHSVIGPFLARRGPFGARDHAAQKLSRAILADVLAVRDHLPVGGNPFIFTSNRHDCHVSNPARGCSRRRRREAHGGDHGKIRPVSRRPPRSVLLSCLLRPTRSNSPYIQHRAVQRVRKTALQLARIVSVGLPEDRQPDLLTVELAALLHDVLDKKYVSAEQAADPYAYFVPFFENAASECGLDLVEDGRARIIARIIDNVSWTTEKKRLAAGQIEDWHRQCVELQCVQDADRLDAIGAFGE